MKTLRRATSSRRAATEQRGRDALPQGHRGPEPPWTVTCDHGLGSMPHHATHLPCHVTCHIMSQSATSLCQPGRPGLDTVTEPCPGVPGRKGLSSGPAPCPDCSVVSSQVPPWRTVLSKKKTPPCCPSLRGGRDSFSRPEGQGSHPGPRSAWPVGSPPGSPSAQGSPHSLSEGRRLKNSQ